MSRMYPQPLRGPFHPSAPRAVAPVPVVVAAATPAPTSSRLAVAGQAGDSTGVPGTLGVPARPTPDTRRTRAPPPFFNATAGGHPHRISNRVAPMGMHHHHHHGHQPHGLAAGSGGTLWSQFPWSQPRVLIVNPMHIVNLSEHTKSRLVRFIETIKRFSEKWFSHVLLLLFLAIYACLGAYVFISFEGRNEQYEKQMIIDMRVKIVNDSWNARDRAKVAYFELLKVRFEEYERLLNHACAMGMTTSSLESQWTFWGALFYSMTVFTTIGYGHLTPITFAGRVATMIYAIFGIPILLMVLADLGKLLTRVIKYGFNKLRVLFWSLFRRKSAVKTRKIIADNTNQYMGVARDAINKGFAYIPYVPQALRSNSMRAKNQAAKNKQQLQHSAREQAATANMNPRPDGASAELEMKERTSVIVTSSTPSPAVSPTIDGGPPDVGDASQAGVVSSAETPQELGFDDVDDEFDLPVSVALALLVLYMMFGAIIFSAWEGWGFFDSLYFVFISMSTIGFGDLVPQHPKRMMATFIYLLFGLALTSMCINVVQEKIHATFLRAKMQIGEKMGLDLEQIMADDYYEDGEYSPSGADSPAGDGSGTLVSQAGATEPGTDNVQPVKPTKGRGSSTGASFTSAGSASRKSSSSSCPDQKQRKISREQSAGGGTCSIPAASPASGQQVNLNNSDSNNANIDKMSVSDIARERPKLKLKQQNVQQLQQPPAPPVLVSGNDQTKQGPKSKLKASESTPVGPSDSPAVARKHAALAVNKTDQQQARSKSPELNRSISAANEAPQPPARSRWGSTKFSVV